MPVYNYYYLVDGKFNPGALTVHGPTIPVQVDVPSALAQAMNVTGQQIPRGIPGRALIDTGASITAVDAGIISQLGVPPVSRARVLTPSGEAEQDVFPATLSFPGTPLPRIEFARLVGSQLRQQGIIVLNGRDLLSNFVLVYNGPGGHISLSY